jgi:hypothetical protein
LPRPSSSQFTLQQDRRHIIGGLATEPPDRGSPSFIPANIKPSIDETHASNLPLQSYGRNRFDFIPAAPLSSDLINALKFKVSLVWANAI